MSLLDLLHLLVTILLLPSALALIGHTLAGILAQDGWSKDANAAIAWTVLALAAAGSMWLNGGFSSDWLAVGRGLTSLGMTLLVSGGLWELRPFLLYLDFLQSNVFAIVQKFSAPPLAPQPPPPAQHP